MPKAIEEWIEARIQDEQNGEIKRLTVPDLYDHFGGDWQKTLEAFEKLKERRAMRRVDGESADKEGGANP